MRSSSRAWRLFAVCLAATAVALAVVWILAESALRRWYLDRALADLEAQAVLVEHIAGDHLDPANAAATDSLCKALGRATKSRITFIAPNGRVLGDSEVDPARMELHSDRPEFLQAMQNGIGSGVRHSPTIGTRMVYAAVRLGLAESPSGVARVSLPYDRVVVQIAEVRRSLLPVAMALLLFLALIDYLIIAHFAVPIESLERAARRMAQGDLSPRLKPDIGGEYRGIAVALNEAAAGLERRIAGLTAQNNQLESVLTAMTEGVVAVDRDRRILMLNNAAANLLGMDTGSAYGRLLTEAARLPGLTRFADRLLEEQRYVEGELEAEGGERHLDLHGAPLKDATGRAIGGLIVLHDITRLKRLENIRRDFAANVSHELRTPITAIKGFVETLQDGALSDPASAQKFLDIIARHVDRLNSIIEDILQLARIEQDAETAQIELKQHSVRGVLESAIRICQSKADAKNIPVTLNCPPDITAHINPPLLERAVANLIDNAINYSEPGSPVVVSAEMVNGQWSMVNSQPATSNQQSEIRNLKSEIIISVSDHGPGIEERHIPRLFERFYRVDPDRSRAVGGTGLGLAIVKHITLAHKGRNSVTSKVGSGSTFRIHLPIM